MKKLLGAALVLTMGVTCMGALAACDSCGSDSNGNDAEVAKSVIASVRDLHADIAVETPSDYDVYGQVKVEGENYLVNWSVSSATVNNISDYVSVGTMDETSKKVPISITSSDTVIEYKLTASVKVGDVTETADFNKKIPVSEKVYSVAEVKTLGASLEKGSYYEVDGAAAQILVKGYVVDPGTWSSQYNNYTGVFIVDTYSADKDKNSADAFQVYRIGKDDKFVTQDGDLSKGDLITVKGFVQNYNGTVQVSYKDKETPTVVAIKKAEKSDADKVAAAKNAVKLDSTRFIKLKEVDLPAESSEATLTWAVKGESDLVKVEDGKLKIVKLPETVGEVKVTITVTIKSGDVTDTKDIEIRVINVGELSLTHAGTQADPFTADEVKAIANSLEDNDYYRGGEVDPKLVYITGYVVDAGSWNSQYNNLNNVYIADAADKTKTDGVMIYRIVPDSTYITKAGDVGLGDLITVSGYIQNYKGDTPEVTYNGNVNVTCVALTKGEAPDPGPGPDPTPVPEGAVKFDFSNVEVAAAGDYADIAAAKLTEIFDAAGVNVTVVGTKVFAGNNGTSGDCTGSGFLKLGSSKANGQLKLTFDKAVTKVDIKCQAWNNKATDTVSVNGSAGQALNIGSSSVLTFDLATSATEISIDVAKRGFIFEIIVYFAD